MYDKFLDMEENNRIHSVGAVQDIDFTGKVMWSSIALQTVISLVGILLV